MKVKFLAAALTIALFFFSKAGFNSQKSNFSNVTCRRVHSEAISVHPMLMSTRDMIQYVQQTGRKAVIMAVNPRSVPDITIPAIMQAAMDTGTPIIFELAASEMNVDPDASLTAAYTGLTPAMLAEKINYWADKLSLNVPYAIHGDHTSVKKNTPEAIAAAEALVKAEIAAGFSSIALDPSHCMELDPAKLVQRLNVFSYQDLLLIPDVGPATAQKIIDHGEFKSLDELSGIDGISEGKAATIRTYLELLDNINITVQLAQLIPESMGLEVEVGEIGHTDPETGEQVLTTVLEAVTYIKALQKRGIYPDMLAIHNGTAHGNNFDAQGNIIPQLGINLQRTREVADANAPLGVKIAQHGTSGTSMENLNLFPSSGIFKANVATNWQDIMWKNLPQEMQDKIIAWQWENFGNQRSKYRTDAEFLDKTRKYANKPLFRGEFGGIPQANQDAIYQQAYDSAVEYFRAFNSVGLVDANLKNILAQGELGSIVIDNETGQHIARLSVSGRRVLQQEGLSSADILKGIEEGRYEVVSQQDLVDKALEHKENCTLVFTGGGDAAGINAVISSAVQRLKELKPEMTVLGIRNAGAGLVVGPEEFHKQLVLIDDLIAQDVAAQGSTFLGSSRIKPFKTEELKAITMKNIQGFGGWFATGGDDNLKTAKEVAGNYPNMIVLATAKTIDGDVMVDGQGVQCLGFNTAAVQYRRELYSIAQSAMTHGEENQPMIIVVETFGRDTGRLAFESARPDNFDGLSEEEIKRQQDLGNSIRIVVPEQSVKIDEIANKVEDVINNQPKYDKSVVLVVAEGYRPENEPDIVKTFETDHAGHPQLTGIGAVLKERLEALFPGYKVRLSLLNYEGRGGLTTDYDRIMGEKTGEKMAELLAQGVTGGMFVGYTNDMDPFTEKPVVLELRGISDQNTLDRYNLETLIRNGVLIKQPE